MKRNKSFTGITTENSLTQLIRYSNKENLVFDELTYDLINQANHETSFNRVISKKRLRSSN